MPKKLLIFHTHPIQYLSPLYRCLAERGNIDLLVVYLTDAGLSGHFDPGFKREVAWDIDLMSGYRSIILQKGRSIIDRGFFRRYDNRLHAVLRRESPDWIYIYGYNNLANWILLCSAKSIGARVLYSADSNARIDRGVLRKAFKALPVRSFFSMVDIFFYAAEANKDYLSSYGVTTEKMRWCPFAIEVDRFRQYSGVGIKNRKYDFAWIGKLNPRKRVGDFLNALLLLRNDGIKFKAVIGGDGEELSLIRSLGASLLHDGHLEYLGFLNQTEVPAALTAAEVFVLTSEYEPYGLAATEAVAAGCALIATDMCGCVGSLGSVQPNRNALVYHAGNVAALYEHMKSMLSNSDLREKLQNESRLIAPLHDVCEAAERIERVVLNE